MDDQLMNYYKSNVPDLFIKKKCEEIINKIKDIKLPNVDEYEEEIRKILKIKKNVEFKDDNYGLALKFYLLRHMFVKIYSKSERDEYKQIIEWLANFDFYLFDLIKKYKEKSFFTTDRQVNIATDYLRFYIEYFVNKYEFLLKEEDIFDIFKIE